MSPSPRTTAGGDDGTAGTGAVSSSRASGAGTNTDGPSSESVRVEAGGDPVTAPPH